LQVPVEVLQLISNTLQCPRQPLAEWQIVRTVVHNGIKADGALALGN
jgi:hypothetical protein